MATRNRDDKELERAIDAFVATRISRHPRVSIKQLRTVARIEQMAIDDIEDLRLAVEQASDALNRINNKLTVIILQRTSR